VEKKARRGNFFYGCNRYPKCDFTAPNKPVDQPCPECGSVYLLEKTLKDGVFLVCPNSRVPSKKPVKAEKPAKKAAAKSAAKKSAAKVAAAAPVGAPVKTAAQAAVEPGTCTFSKKIGEAPVESAAGAEGAASVA
jgi:DNA topoisomerase-1